MTGSGTLLDPYIIYDVDDLQAMGDHLDAYYELANDIDAAATVGWNAGLGFLPIGTPVAPFTGVFDGKGYEISGLYIDRPALIGVGLFSFCTGSSIRNVGIVNCNITGDLGVGALAGALLDNSIIKSCYSTGLVVGNNTIVGGLIGDLGTTVGPAPASSASQCWSSCQVTGRNQVGGLFGRVTGDSSVYRSFATGNVSASLGAAPHNQAGGLIGWISPTGVGHVENCYARGDVTALTSEAGGLIGDYTDGVIIHCYSTGASVTPVNAGGLVGRITGGVTVTDSFWDTDTSGLLVSAGGTGRTTAEMKTQSTFTDAGWDFAAIWTICEGVNNDYPCLIGVTPSCVLAPVIPTVTTNPATLISHLSAILNGLLDDDGGEACEWCGFEWGLTDAYGNTTPTDSRVTGQTFSQAIHGLFPGFTYHFRAFATNSAGIGYGTDRSFTTTPTFSKAHALSREEL